MVAEKCDFFKLMILDYRSRMEEGEEEGEKKVEDGEARECR